MEIFLSAAHRWADEKKSNSPNSGNGGLTEFRKTEHDPNMNTHPKTQKGRHGLALEIAIHPEVKAKYEKIGKIPLHSLGGVLVTYNMPSQHAADKASIGAWIPRTLKRRLEIKAESRSMSITEFVEWVLFKETNDVELKSTDYEDIAQATLRAEKRAGKNLRERRGKRVG